MLLLPLSLLSCSYSFGASLSVRLHVFWSSRMHAMDVSGQPNFLRIPSKATYVCTILDQIQLKIAWLFRINFARKKSGSKLAHLYKDRRRNAENVFVLMQTSIVTDNVIVLIYNGFPVFELQKNFKKCFVKSLDECISGDQEFRIIWFKRENRSLFPWQGT